jgi:hypothetical protein
MPVPDLPRSHAESIETFGVEFPIATAEITMEIAGTDIRLGPRQTEIATNVFAGCWMNGSEVGFQIGEPSDDSSPPPPTERAA